MRIHGLLFPNHGGLCTEFFRPLNVLWVQQRFVVGGVRFIVVVFIDQGRWDKCLAIQMVIEICLVWSTLSRTSVVCPTNIEFEIDL